MKPLHAACAVLLALLACTVTPPREPALSDAPLVPEDAPVFDQGLRGLTRADLDLSNFWVELPDVEHDEPVMIHSLTYANVAARADAGVVNIYTRRLVERELKIGFELQNLLPFELPIVSKLLSYIPFQVPVPFRDQGFALGSGFVVNRQGYLLTNAHVIQNATDVIAVFSDHREVPARIVGADPLTDTALLRVPPDPNLEPLPFGSSTNLEVGELVLAVGNPLGLSHSVTSGVVSAVERTIPGTPELLDYVQTDSAINPGNSGGPLLNLHGEVVGMNTAVLQQAQNIGFAIPIDTIETVIPLLLMGNTDRGWLGMSVGFGEGRAPVVDAVEKDSPAARAGLEVGDVVVEMNGQPIPTIVALRRLALGLVVGDEVEIVVARRGERRTIATQLVKRPG